MIPVKKCVVSIYIGILFVTVALIFDISLPLELMFYVFGGIAICAGVWFILRGHLEEDIGTKTFILFVGVLTLFMSIILAHSYYTAGEYSAVIHYEKTERGYVLRGVEIYAKPYRLSGKYYLRLFYEADRYDDFGLIYFDRSKVRITRKVEEGESYYMLYINAEVIPLSKDTEFTKYIDLKGCLIVKRPLDFDVELVPLKGGWCIIVSDTKIVIS